jgi:signal transduction histidine kinase/ActR/RegA family two-component response regulator
VAASTPVLNQLLPNADSVTVVEYPTQDAAKQAVRDGDVDAALLYRYDAEYTVNQDKNGKLAFTLIPNSTIQIRAAIRAESDHTLMSILMKCMKHMDDGQKSAIVSECISFSATEMTLGDYIALHPLTAVAVCVFLVIVLFVIVGSMFYSSRERMYRKKLEEACRQAEAANNAKTTFLFNMSHDIRTPMNAIIGFADLMEHHMDDPEKRADYLKKIQDSSAVLLSIINNVLEMARIEKGTIELAENAWSAEQFNDTLYSVFHDMMTEKGITFTRQIEVEHSYVFCDPIKLREVFLNILSNAYKYTERGGSVNMHLEEIPSDRKDYAVYQTTISDTGIGMDAEFVPRIFEEFSRENNSTENKIEGTGLGMAIVKRLVELMDGTIEVTSEKGRGSSFVVTIPHRIADKSDLIDHSAVKPDEQLFVGKRILLAEDNDLNAEIAYEILTEAGFDVERAENGQMCIDMLLEADAGYYDVILMDIQMPVMNGFEATKHIRGLSDPIKAQTPIIAMTANAFEEDRREAYHCGMNDHLAKPVNVHELMKTLTGVLKD